MKEPLKEIRSSLSERIVQALFGPGAETVQRDTKSGDSHSRHVDSSLNHSKTVAGDCLLAAGAWLPSAGRGNGKRPGLPLIGTDDTDPEKCQLNFAVLKDA